MPLAIPARRQLVSFITYRGHMLCTKSQTFICGRSFPSYASGRLKIGLND